jgi:tetratricopeptide (TPR) repeat protein
MFRHAAALRWTTWVGLLVIDLAALALGAHGIQALDTDMFYHLAGGRYMAQQHRILDQETFSFTVPGHPWTNHSWLFQYLLFRVYEVGGFTALVAFRAGVVVLTASLLFVWCRRRARGDDLVALAMTLLAIGLYSIRADNIRPHLADYLFLVVAMLLLERLWLRPGRFEPWLPLLCVLWANLHGVTYPVVLMVVGVHGAAALLPRARESLGVLLQDPDARRWPALVLLCVAAFAVNPFGVRLYATPLTGVDTEAIRHIQEMQPVPWRTLLDLAPDLGLSPNSLAAYVGLCVLTAVPWWIRQRDRRALLLLLGSGALAAARWRFLVEFAILVLPFVGEAWSGAVDPAGRRGRWRTAASAGIVGLMLLAVGHTTWSAMREGRYAGLSRTAYPVGAARFLDAWKLEGNAFSDANASGYVEWMLYPRVRVFMDMRTPEAFDSEIFWLYREVAFAADATPLRRLERRWPIDFVLLRREARLGRALAADPSGVFRLAYADDQFVLFVHERVRRPRQVPVLEVLDPFDASAGYVGALALGARTTLRTETARLLEVSPANHLAHQADLAVMVRAGEAAAAYQRSAGLMAAFPWEPRYPYAAGMALRALHRDADALPLFQRALDLDRSLGVAAVALAETALPLGRYADGRRVMEHERERRRDRLTAAEYRLLGDLRYRSGSPADAVRAYQRALWLVADDQARAEIENNLGSAYVDLGQPDRALDHLEAAIRQAPGFAEAEFNRARAWARTGRDAEARSVFRRLADDASAPAEVRARARARMGEDGSGVGRPGG